MTGVPEALVEDESDPQVVPEQPAPASAQLTPLFCESLVTVAVKFCVPIPACTLCVPGATVTRIVGAADTVMVALPVRVPSATDVAVRVIVAGEGSPTGAV